MNNNQNNYNSSNFNYQNNNNNNNNNNNPQNSTNFIGPFLKYSNCDLNNKLYYATVLIVSKQGCELPLFLTSPHQQKRQIDGKVIDRYKDNIFIRYNLEVPIEPQQIMVTYTISNKSYSFYIQGYNQTWRWAFFSCNGFSNDVTKEKQIECGGANPLWDDLYRQHNFEPFHCMVGGGDQLYCDDVFLGQGLKSWLDIPSRKERDRIVFSSYVEQEIMDYYFNNYCIWFTNGTFGKAAATIPYSMVIDDHDIFDGFGSYPERMMNSPYFQGIKRCAMKFYLLFQHHTTDKLAEKDNYFGVQSYTWLKNFGPKTSIIGIDNRSERSLNQCLSKESYEQIFRKLYQEVPNTCKHLMIILGIPIVYPRLSEAEGVLGTLSTVQHKLNLHKVFHKTGAMSQMVNQFGQPELLDDLCDHWTASEHLQEREEFIVKLQAFAKAKSIRISFLAGDVHLAAAGYFSSSDKSLQVINDFRHMTQIVSSAIVNLPPPDMVVKMLHVNSKEYKLDNFTVEDMYTLFKKDVNEEVMVGKEKCYNRRNWCKVIQDNFNDQVHFSIMVESEDHKYTVPYTVSVLPLIARN
ncbi:hypothetical protein K502DRAFT_292235 [Neoconidiobolus thromboides FSU 785]|nr:hypothetical protein K502DRAFT_292235 [Neoconidiobolus thromboides FSU 785]